MHFQTDGKHKRKYRQMLIISHQLMIGRKIRQVSTGVYSYLPLAQRSIKKIENIIRDEMDKAGGQEVTLPVIQPREIG